MIDTLLSFKRMDENTLSLRFKMGYFDLTARVVSSIQGEKVYLPQGFYVPDKSAHEQLVGEILGHWEKVINSGLS